MAFDGTLLNRPSDPGGERAVSEGLFVVLLRASTRRRRPSRCSRRTATASPRRSGSRYKVVRPSTVTVDLVGPDRRRARRSRPGRSSRASYRSTGTGWPRTAPRSRRAPGVSRSRAVDDHGPVLDRRPVVLAEPDARRAAASRRRCCVPAPRNASLRATFTLTRPARVTASVETATGAVVRRRGAPGASQPGTRTIAWNGLAGRRLAHTGRYVLRVSAANEVGRSTCRRRSRSRRVAAEPRARLAARARRLHPERDHRRDHGAVGDYGLYAVFLPDARRRRLPGGERAGDGLRRRARRGRVRGAGRRRSSARHVPSGFRAYLAIALAGTIGYLLGSIGGWAIGLYGGRPFVERHGRWLHLSPEKLDRADALVRALRRRVRVLRAGDPGVRSFVAIPAGIATRAARPLHGADVPRLGDLVLRLRRRRLGARRELGALPRGVPLRGLSCSADRRGRRRARLALALPPLARRCARRPTARRSGRGDPARRSLHWPPCRHPAR